MEKLLVMGLGITGQSALEALKEGPYTLYAYDDREEMKEGLAPEVFWYEGQDLDLVIKSPGIPLDQPLVRDLLERGLPVISDVELAYRLSRSRNFIAVTGTNGKTTVASLIQAMLEDAGLVSHLAGNIGRGVLGPALKAGKEDYLVVECSSFQLETTCDFKPAISLITNLTEDHLDHHKTLEAYQEAKVKVYENQGPEDLLIINYNDPFLASLEVQGPKVWAIGTLGQEGTQAYLKDGRLYYDLGRGEEVLMEAKDLSLPGDHNIQNFLQVLLVGLGLGLEPESIRGTFESFRGVAHRTEFVLEHDGIRVYNDSKGTNPDSTIRAVEAMEGPVHLLAGGFDKGSHFGPMFEEIGKRLAGLYLFGQTGEVMAREAKEAGVQDIYLYEDMEEAGLAAMKRARSGQALLLSPACASWDQYKNFEVRGQAFKDLITREWGKKLEEDSKK